MKPQKVKEWSNHHRKPTSCGGTSKPSNISLVEVKAHRAYHHLFSNLPPDEVARILSEVWIDPAFILVAISRRKL